MFTLLDNKGVGVMHLLSMVTAGFSFGALATRSLMRYVQQDDKFGILMLARFAPALTTCLKDGGPLN